MSQVPARRLTLPFMATYAQISARLLRDAARFFRNVGAQNEALREQLEDNAKIYDQVADLVEKDPAGELDVGDTTGGP